MAFYELRRYRVRPGRMDEWVRYMEEVIIPFQVARGMVIAGSFRGEEDDSTYVWLRRFESEAERENASGSTRRCTSRTSGSRRSARASAS